MGWWAVLTMETENTVLDEVGRYRVQLGATTRGGVPPRVFIVGEARWLGVTVVGESELPRGELLMTPYAAKALDADTLEPIS